MFDSYPDVLTVPQCAQALGIGKNNVYRLINTGALSHKKIGKLIRVPKIYLIEYLKMEISPTESVSQ